MAFVLTSSTFNFWAFSSGMTKCVAVGADTLLIVMYDATPAAIDIHRVWNGCSAKDHVYKAIAIFEAS